jgi:hypothetical protein
MVRPEGWRRLENSGEVHMDVLEGGDVYVSEQEEAGGRSTLEECTWTHRECRSVHFGAGGSKMTEQSGGVNQCPPEVEMCMFQSRRERRSEHGKGVHMDAPESGNV